MQHAMPVASSKEFQTCCCPGTKQSLLTQQAYFAQQVLLAVRPDQHLLNLKHKSLMQHSCLQANLCKQMLKPPTLSQGMYAQHHTAVLLYTTARSTMKWPHDSLRDTATTATAQHTSCSHHTSTLLPTICQDMHHTHHVCAGVAAAHASIACSDLQPHDNCGSKSEARLGSTSCHTVNCQALHAKLLLRLS